MNTYTVIGLDSSDAWGDGANMRDATFVEAVSAPTPTMAARWARLRWTFRKISTTLQGHDPNDIQIIAVFEGEHVDQYEPAIDTADYELQIRAEGDA